jgi:NCS1 family nucleobase:cation symporter-1
MISSSMIVDGLSWWQSWICVWVGYFLAACFVCLTGRIGAVYHISFPVVCRSSFGVWGSLWPVLNRTVMAIIWYGVQGFIGGKKYVSQKADEQI